ncbi:hypothetical protein ENUP19_0381G0003 [Entamoeba nuttalli]|uniref:Uncharacterized protein n=1 Tax=Entamoeba nuttalli TaxID=412467 RepID=A0ABQ0DZE1_9EUKA
MSMFLLLIVFASATETILCMEQGIEKPSQCQNILIARYPITSDIDRIKCIEYSKGKSLKVYTTKSDQTNNIGYHIKYFKDAMCDKESENQNNDNVIAIEKSIITKTSKNDTPKDNTPKDDTPKDNTPKDNTPKDNTPKDNTPKDDTPKDNTPKDNTPKDNTPKDNTPKDNTPKDNTPKDNTPNDDYNEPSNLNGTSHIFVAFVVIATFFLF